MQSNSGSQVSGLRSRSRSAQNLASVPAQSEAYPITIPRKYLKGGTAKLRAQELEAPIGESQLKATKKGHLGSGNLSTTDENFKPYVGGQPPTLQIKAATVSSKSRLSTSKGHAIATGPSMNVTTATPIPRAGKQASQQQNTGPTKRMPITTKSFAASTPPLKEKTQKCSKSAILHELDTASLFSPVRSLPNEESIEVCYNKKYDLPSPLLRPSLRAKCLDTPPVRSPLKTLLSQDLRRTRSALSLPSCHLKTRVKGTCKTVTWDPSLEPVDSEMPSISESAPEDKEAENSGAPQQVSTRKLEVKDCVETLKEWGNADRSKLANLIEALKQLKERSETTEKECAAAKSNNGHDGEVLITVVESMDPRVPQFEPSRIAESKTKIIREEEQERYRPAMLGAGNFNDSDSNKENIPDFHLQPLAFPQDKRVHRIKKRISVIDDYNSPGREVDSFADWYAQMQLREFAKRYPLTGRRASAGRQAAKTSPGIAEVSDDMRSVSGGSDPGAKEFRSSIARSENRSNLGEAGQTGRRDEGRAAHGAERGNGYAGGRKLALFKRHEAHFKSDLAARKHAANIQQQLEMLLLREKERKALGAVPGTAHMSLGPVDCGANPHYAGLGYEESCPAPVLSWIPSERLRL